MFVMRLALSESGPAYSRLVLDKKRPALMCHVMGMLCILSIAGCVNVSAAAADDQQPYDVTRSLLSENGSQSVTNVLLLLLVIRFSVPQGSVVSQPVVMKLFTHIKDNILHRATVA